MKFLHLKFYNAKLIRAQSDKNSLGYNRFFYPINKMHIYNSLCVLMDRTPKPQARVTGDRFMPLYSDLLNAVSDGFIKIKMVVEHETITTIKKDWNANAKSAPQLTWVDCKNSTGTLFPLFICQVSKIINIPDEEVTKIAFDDIIHKIQTLGHKNEIGEIEYTDKNITRLINWCAINSSSVISNYIEEKQEASRPTGFGKRVNRGIANISVYEGAIYIPMSEELIAELIKYTRGFSTLLDGGLVKIAGYSEIYEDELFDFTKISELNETKKFSKKIVRAIDWSDTIYNKIDINNVESSINKIIDIVGVDISKNQSEYDNMLKNIKDISLKDITTSKVGRKLNFFIENAINKQYKYE